MNCIYCSAELELTEKYENMCRYVCNCFSQSPKYQEAPSVAYNSTYDPELRNAQIDFYYEPHDKLYFILQECDTHNFTLYWIDESEPYSSSSIHFKMIYEGNCFPPELKHKVIKILNNLAWV